MPLRRTRGLARTVGRTAVIAGTATAVSGHVANRQAARAQQDQAQQDQAQQDQAQQDQAQQDQAQAPAAPFADQVDVVDQLKRFAELRDQGILTEEEFAAQKAKLLGS
jgi:hemolysin activation/secretion protein